MVMHFTHDIVMDTFLPGVAPIGRSVQLPVVVVAGFEGDKVASEHIYWDQASLLVQHPRNRARGKTVPAGKDGARRERRRRRGARGRVSDRTR